MADVTFQLPHADLELLSRVCSRKRSRCGWKGGVANWRTLLLRGRQLLFQGLPPGLEVGLFLLQLLDAGFHVAQQAIDLALLLLDTGVAIVQVLLQLNGKGLGLLGTFPQRQGPVRQPFPGALQPLDPGFLVGLGEGLPRLQDVSRPRLNLRGRPGRRFSWTGQMELEAEGTQVNHVAILEQLVLHRPAVELGAAPARAVAQPPAFAAADDQQMHWEDVRRLHLHVTTGGPAQHQDVAIQRPDLAGGVAVGNDQRGLRPVKANQF